MNLDMKKRLCPPVVKLPKGISVVLASASPRRKELCTKMGLAFRVTPADCDESYDKESISPSVAVELLSRRKCLAVAEKENENVLVIASDTIVDLEGRALGKPKDEADAFAMLRGLSGKHHFVHTGVAVAYGGKCLVAHDSTEVCFRSITEQEIIDYVKSGEPMDKAGAYAIQGLGGAFVSEINGDFDTVVGLSCKVLAMLTEQMIQDEQNETE